MLGLGIGNKAILEYLKKEKAIYYCYDDKDPQNNLKQEDIELITCVVKSSGINNDHKLIKFYKDRNVKIITDLEFYYLYRKYKNFSIVISGTNGKSTTVKLIKHLIKDIDLAGNIGKPIGLFLDSRRPIVIEASSYMAEYCYNCEANIVGFVNIYSNHLKHHKDFNSYLLSKKNLINPKLEQLIFINSKDHKYFKDNKYLSFYDILDKYLNEYNNYLYYDNILLSVIIALNYGIKLNEILYLLKSFENLKHRLESFYIFYNNNQSVEFINDSKATNVIALNYALNYYKDKLSNMLLIIGGKIKEEDYNFSFLNVKKILINGENRYILEDRIKKYGIEYIIYNNLNDLLDDLINNLNDINIVLFSPGAESYDQFDNFEKRGEFFKQKVLTIFNNVIYL